MIGFSTAGKLNSRGIPLRDRYFHTRIGGRSLGRWFQEQFSHNPILFVGCFFGDLFRGFGAKAFWTLFRGSIMVSTKIKSAPPPEYALNGISKLWANKISRTVSFRLLDSQASSMRGNIISVY